MIPILNGANFIDLYDYQAYPILKHLNIYSATHKIFPYSPVSMFLPALCAILTDLLRIPFYMAIRLPGVIADVLIAISLYMVMWKKGQKNAFLWGLFYAVNPVSILITSFHGNIMALPVLFTFLAYVVLLFGIQNNYRLSALLLGLAIGLRGYPVLLLPLFIIKLNLTFKKKIEYILYATVPITLSFIPFLILDYQSVLREVFAYSGFIDYGIAAILRSIISFKSKMLLYGLPNNLHILLVKYSKILFVITYLVLAYALRRKKMIISILAVFVAFYFIYAGLSSQYFIWLLPFAFLIQDRMLKYYLIFATWALTNFYLLYHPKIIFGDLSPFKFSLQNLLLGEIISLSLLWVTCFIWLLFLIIKKDKHEECLFL